MGSLETGYRTSINGTTSNVPITNTTARSIHTGIPGLYQHITAFSIVNEHATVDTRVYIICNGVTKHTVHAKAGGGGETLNLGIEGKLIGSLGQGWQIQCETTGAQVTGSLHGFLSDQPN